MKEECMHFVGDFEGSCNDPLCHACHGPLELSDEPHVCKPSVTAVIPVRAGSKRIPDKWNQELEPGKSLLRIKIEQLKEAAGIDRVVVSTDSFNIIRVAADLGADIHQRRPEYCDEASRNFGEVVRNIASEVDGDVILWAPCCAPFFTSCHLSGIVGLFTNHKLEGYDSVVAVHTHSRYYLKGDFTPRYTVGLDHKPTNDPMLDQTHEVTCGAWVANRADMVRWAYFHGPRPQPYFVGKIAALDIDTPEDLGIARALWPKQVIL